MDYLLGDYRTWIVFGAVLMVHVHRGRISALTGSCEELGSVKENHRKSECGGRIVALLTDDWQGKEILESLDEAGFYTIWTDRVSDIAGVVETERADLILLDVTTLKGRFKVIKRIRQCSTTPIVLLTLSDQPEEAMHGLAAGVDYCIPKRLTSLEMPTRLDAAFAKRGTAAPLPGARDLDENVSLRTLSPAGVAKGG